MQSVFKQGRRQLFRARGSRWSGCQFTVATTLPLIHPKKLKLAPISWVVLVEARGPDPCPSPPAVAPVFKMAKKGLE